jgi:hypothetical protein|tara:strand:+ start:577 stop:1596 length:1020 start_codon:yes stop_codon:yes gene_type:complete
MPHAPGHGGDFGAQYSQQIADTASKIRGLENTKTFQQIVNEAASQQLQNIQDQQGQPGFETTLLDDQGRGQITADFGKRSGKFNDIRDKLNTQGYGALNEAEKSIANVYLGITGGPGSVPTNFEKAIDDFIKFEPGGREAYLADSGLLGALNVAATTIPEAVAEKSIIGNVISSAFNKAKDAGKFVSGLFPQGFMPGMGDEITRFTTQLAGAPAGAKEDFTTMLGINKDDDPVKSVLREELDIKKNTSNDISPDTFMQAEARSPGIEGVDFLGGTPISQALSGTTGVDLSRFIDPNTGRTRSDVKPQFQNLNLGQLQNLIRDESGYFDRVIQQLGLGGR